MASHVEIPRSARHTECYSVPERSGCVVLNKIKDATMQRTIVESFVKMVVCHKVTVQRVTITDGQVLESSTTLEEDTPVFLDVDRHETSDFLTRSSLNRLSPNGRDYRHRNPHSASAFQQKYGQHGKGSDRQNPPNIRPNNVDKLEDRSILHVTRSDSNMTTKSIDSNIVCGTIQKRVVTTSQTANRELSECADSDMMMLDVNSSSLANCSQYSDSKLYHRGGNLSTFDEITPTAFASNRETPDKDVADVYQHNVNSETDFGFSDLTKLDVEMTNAELDTQSAEEEAVEASCEEISVSQMNPKVSQRPLSTDDGCEFMGLEVDHDQSNSSDKTLTRPPNSTISPSPSGDRFISKSVESNPASYEDDLECIPADLSDDDSFAFTGEKNEGVFNRKLQLEENSMSVCLDSSSVEESHQMIVAPNGNYSPQQNRVSQHGSEKETEDQHADTSINTEDAKPSCGNSVYDEPEVVSTEKTLQYHDSAVAIHDTSSASPYIQVGEIELHEPDISCTKSISKAVMEGDEMFVDISHSVPFQQLPNSKPPLFPENANEYSNKIIETIDFPSNVVETHMTAIEKTCHTDSVDHVEFKAVVTSANVRCEPSEGSKAILSGHSHKSNFQIPKTRTLSFPSNSSSSINESNSSLPIHIKQEPPDDDCIITAAFDSFATPTRTTRNTAERSRSSLRNESNEYMKAPSQSGTRIGAGQRRFGLSQSSSLPQSAVIQPEWGKTSESLGAVHAQSDWRHSHASRFTEKTSGRKYMGNSSQMQTMVPETNIALPSNSCGIPNFLAAAATIGSAHIAQTFSPLHASNSPSSSEKMRCLGCTQEFNLPEELAGHVCNFPSMRLPQTARDARRCEEVSSRMGQSGMTKALGKMVRFGAGARGSEIVGAGLGTAKKPYTCCMCSKSFWAKSSLDLHMRVHTGHRPYQCRLCGKCFSQSGHLATHIKFHVGIKPYRCDECGRAYVMKGDLIRHLKTRAHKNDMSCFKTDVSQRVVSNEISQDLHAMNDES